MLFMIALHRAGCAVMLCFLPGIRNQKDSCTSWTPQTVRKMVFLVWMEKTQTDRCHQFPYPFSRKTDGHGFFHHWWQHASHWGNCTSRIVPYCRPLTWDCILIAQGECCAIEWRQASLLVNVKVLPRILETEWPCLFIFLFFLCCFFFPPN